MNSAVPFGASLSGSDSPSKSIYLKPSCVKASIGSVTFSRLAARSLCCAEARMAASDSSYLDSAATEIIVVRHGETEWNADGRIQGHLDVKLNDVGREQAAAAADRLSKENKISLVYSSDLKRALETAQSIAARCGVMEVIKDPNLRERHLGDLQGLVFREASRDNPEAYQAFLSRDTDKALPGGGESLDQLYKRCASCLENIGRKSHLRTLFFHRGQQVVVVTRGGVIRSLYKRACGRSVGKIPNTSVNVFHLVDGDNWTIKSWGDVSHLDPTRFLQSGFGGDKTAG